MKSEEQIRAVLDQLKSFQPDILESLGVKKTIQSKIELLEWILDDAKQ